jgi:DNA helicase-2/ATP-dependent DNA helicase PcrA
MNENEDKVTLMTIHSAKGLEFEKVFLIGLEEGIFPGTQSIYEGNSEIEEERRLMYVAITRAKRSLSITKAITRMVFGSTNRNLPSRFLKELPAEYCNVSISAPQTFFSSSYSSQPKTQVPRTTPIFASQTTIKSGYSTIKNPDSSSSGQYKTGMRVEHKAFGKGLIVGASAMGNDTLLEIAFDTVGTKKIMAGYAKLKIL